jgi:Secretion system C-terminal sorting domain
MKKSIITTILGLISICSMIAQVDTHPWSPTGATWLYRGSSLTSQLYFKLSYQKDTLFSGKNVKKIVVSKFEYIGIPPNLVRTKETFVRNEYMYNSQDSVFWYNDNTFQLLYLFSASNGSSWAIQKSNYYTCLDSGTPNTNLITVRNTQQVSIGGRQFNIIDANPQPYWTIGTRIIKNIGPTRSPFPVPGSLGCPIVDGNIGLPESLSCYFDNTRGTIDMDGVGNCQGLITKTNNLDKNESKLFVISPNPVINNLQIRNNSFVEIESINVFDMLGKQYLTVKNINNSNPDIDVSSLPDGMFVIVLHTSNKLNHSIKFVKIK